MARTIIVTGAESGIGAACAAAFGATGDRVAIGYFADRDLANKSADAVVAAGGEAMAVQFHVDDEGSVDGAFTSIEQTEPLARHKVVVPVVAIGGEKGLGDKVGAAVKRVARHVTAETLPGCGHFVPEECPDALIRHIRAMAAKLA